MNELQKRIIKKEIIFALKKYDGEIEKIEFGEYYATTQILISINISVKKIFNEILYEANELGDFLSDKFIITNQKAYTISETKDIINKIKRNKK